MQLVIGFGPDLGINLFAWSRLQRRELIPLYSSPLPMDHDVRRHGFSSVASHLRQCQSSCPHKVCDDQPTSSTVAAALLATVRLTVAREFADSALFQRAVVKPVLAPAMLLSSHALGRIIQAFVAIAYADAVTGLAPVPSKQCWLVALQNTAVAPTWIPRPPAVASTAYWQLLVDIDVNTGGTIA